MWLFYNKILHVIVGILVRLNENHDFFVTLLDFFFKLYCFFITEGYRESVAGSVIQATGTVEFEDGLRMGVTTSPSIGQNTQ